MKSFDKVPIMDEEYFNQCLSCAKSFGVWVQVNTPLQICLEITKEQALKIAKEGLQCGSIWGQLCSDGRLELSNTSQWLDRLKWNKTV